jgi:hypothetical protein
MLLNCSIVLGIRCTGPQSWHDGDLDADSASKMGNLLRILHAMIEGTETARRIAALEQGKEASGVSVYRVLRRKPRRGCSMAVFPRRSPLNHPRACRWSSQIQGRQGSPRRFLLPDGKSQSNLS